jgi:hypothetical protein
MIPSRSSSYIARAFMAAEIGKRAFLFLSAAISCSLAVVALAAAQSLPVPPVTSEIDVKLSPSAQRGFILAMGWYACERPDGWLYQHDGVVSGFMASNAIARRNDESWSEVTVLANKDATVEIVRLVRDVVQIARSNPPVPGALSRSSLGCYRAC